MSEDFPIPYFVLWKWRSVTYRTTYEAAHVNTMFRMLQRHGVPAEKILCVTDDPRGVECRTHPLWDDCCWMKNVSGDQLPSCYRRLKIFDPATIEAMGVPLGHRVVSMDIDAVILQQFLPLFNRREPFVGWKVQGIARRIVLNGSMFMHNAGEMGWLWDEFDPQTSPRRAFGAGYMGSDQGYLSWRLVNLPNTGGWWPSEHGVLSYTRDVDKTRRLPKTARVVFFAGKHKPWLPYVIQKNQWILRYVDEPKKEIPAAQQSARSNEAANTAVG